MNYSYTVQQVPTPCTGHKRQHQASGEAGDGDPASADGARQAEEAVEGGAGVLQDRLTRPQHRHRLRRDLPREQGMFEAVWYEEIVHNLFLYSCIIMYKSFFLFST